MGFTKTQEELMKFERASLDFYDAEFLSVYWETDPEIVKRLLPPPLKPAKYPVASAFVANYPKTNFGISYKESALFLFAEYDNTVGMYCFAMPVDNDMALIAGREIFGYPKKMAKLYFYHDENKSEGRVERHNITFFEIKFEATNKLNQKDALQIIMELGLNPSDPKAIVYNYKFFRSPQYNSFDYKPRLIREEITMQSNFMQLGTAEISLKHSENDPWSDVKVNRILGGVYLKTNSQMQPGKVVAEISQEEFEPYSYYKIDLFE